MNQIKKVELVKSKIGTSDEWFLVIIFDDSTERGWLIGRQQEVEEIIKKLRAL